MIGDLISAGGRLVGGFLDSATADRNRESQEAMADRNIAKQEQFAREGIRWKVHDAKEAGIHPLYALGANTTSFSPVSISGGSSSNWSDTLGSMGQDISRAVQSTRTAGERVDAFTRTAQSLELEGKKLDNDIKRQTLASAAARTSVQGGQVGPPMPGEVPKAKEFEDIPRLRGDLGEIDTNPRVVNAEDIEKRYGDLAQEAWGLYTAASDWMNHLKGQIHIRKDPNRTGTWRDWIPKFSYRRLYHDPRRDAR